MRGTDIGKSRAGVQGEERPESKEKRGPRWKAGCTSPVVGNLNQECLRHPKVGALTEGWKNEVRTALEKERCGDREWSRTWRTGGETVKTREP